MGFLVAQIIAYLVAAAAIGFVTAWLIRGRLDRQTPPAVVAESGEGRAEEAEDADDAPTKVGLDGKILYLEPHRQRTDDLQRIRGIGPKLERTLNQLGVFRYEQLAQFSDNDIVWMASKLETFPSRIARDRWIEQARELARERQG